MRELLICLSFLLLPFSASASSTDPSAGLYSVVTAMADAGDSTGVSPVFAPSLNSHAFIF